MKNTKFKVTRFTQSDILTASGEGGDPIPGSIPTIYLTTESVNNFNAYKSGADGTLYTQGNYSYWGYTQNSYFDMISGWTPSDKTNTEPESLFTVGANDAKGYKRVLDWLNGAL